MCAMPVVSNYLIKNDISVKSLQIMEELQTLSSALTVSQLKMTVLS